MMHMQNCEERLRLIARQASFQLVTVYFCAGTLVVWLTWAHGMMCHGRCLGLAGDVLCYLNLRTVPNNKHGITCHVVTGLCTCLYQCVVEGMEMLYLFSTDSRWLPCPSCHRGMEHDELELSTEIRSMSARKVRLQEEKLCAKD